LSIGLDFVKVLIETNKIGSVVDIWKSADFLEREQYDLVGVILKDILI